MRTDIQPAKALWLDAWKATEPVLDLHWLKGRFADLAVAGIDAVAASRPVARRVHGLAAQHVGAGEYQEPLPRPAADRLAFVSFCRAMRPLAHGQLLQDLWVLYETGFQQSGYFVEFGAADGMRHSNTYLLESRFSWGGILAEPNPAEEASLRSVRKAVVDTRCVWKETGKVVQLVVPEEPQLATIADYADTDSYSDQRVVLRPPSSVSTVTLNDLLDQYRAPPVIDYLSIDTEGSELDILSAFDFSKRHVRLLSVEHNHRPHEKDLDRLLHARGFERRFRELSRYDGWYRSRPWIR